MGNTLTFTSLLAGGFIFFRDKKGDSVNIAGVEIKQRVNNSEAAQKGKSQMAAIKYHLSGGGKQGKPSNDNK